MSDARIPDATKTSDRQTIRAEEVAHFGALAGDWWDPKGSSAMLHRLNPVRLSFIREAIDAHWGSDTAGRAPLAGKSVLDVGCGAGLLCEPLARLGGMVTGVDAAPENVAAAQAHAKGSGLAIDYRSGELAELNLGKFDLVTSLEVIEHVADKQAFLAGLIGHLAPGGLLILSTPNRTARSRLLLVQGAELVGLVPRGTHHWDDFIAPEELQAMLGEFGLSVLSLRGVNHLPAKGLHLSEDLSLNYIVAVVIDK